MILQLPLLKILQLNHLEKIISIHFPYAGIGHVRIFNDGYIWGGYQYNAQSEQIEIHQELEDRGPLKFGTISENGLALIDLAIVYEYQLALDAYNQAASASERTNAAERIRNADSDEGKDERDNRELTWKAYKISIGIINFSTALKPTKISEIPINPTTSSIDDVSTITQEHLSDGNTPKSTGNLLRYYETAYLQCLITRTNTNVNGFRIHSLVDDNGDEVCLEPRKESGTKAKINSEISIPVGSLNYKLSGFKNSFIDHPLLNHLQVMKDKKIHLPGISPIAIPEKSTSFVLPADVKLELTKDSLLNLEQYGTVSEWQADDELLISTKAEWLDYFKETANLAEVKKLATSLGLTIRFKITKDANDWRRVRSDKYHDKFKPEVYFIPLHGIHNGFSRDDMQSFKYDLKNELNDKTTFAQSWIDEAKVDSEMTTDELSFYPFYEDKQLIAYNADYLPQGLSYSSDETSGESTFYQNHLLNLALGDLDAVKTTVSLTNEEQKNKLLVARDMEISSPIWAANYYQEKQGYQYSIYQQDIISTFEGNFQGFQSVFKAPNLKDNLRFQAWVNHYKNANVDLRNENSIEYTKAALFNGHVGAIIVDSSWINQNWRKGEFMTSGTAEEKQAFARQKIKFQALPETSSSLGRKWYWTLLNSLSDNKQQLAERFISKLMVPERATVFNNQLLKILPKKDIVYEQLEDSFVKSLIMAHHETESVNVFKMTDKWYYQTWKKTIEALGSITGDATNSIYQKVISQYETEAKGLTWKVLGLYPQ